MTTDGGGQGEGSNNGSLFFPSSGGWKPKNKGSTGLVSSETSVSWPENGHLLLGSLHGFFSVHVHVLIFSSDQDTSHIKLGTSHDLTEFQLPL